nr:hypothetical protein [Pseudomonas putida]
MGYEEGDDESILYDAD